MESITDAHGVTMQYTYHKRLNVFSNEKNKKQNWDIVRPVDFRALPRHYISFILAQF